MKKNTYPCLDCDCYDSDMGCTMPSTDKDYACSIYSDEFMSNCFKCVNLDYCSKYCDGCSKDCLHFGHCENCDASSDHCLLKGDLDNSD